MSITGKNFSQVLLKKKNTYLLNKRIYVWKYYLICLKLFKVSINDNFVYGRKTKLKLKRCIMSNN